MELRKKKDTDGIRVDDALERLSFIAPYVKANAKPDSPLAKAFEVFISQWDKYDEPTWGATQCALTQWFNITEEQRRAILNGWNPHDERPTHAEAFDWVKQADVEPVLQIFGQADEVLDISPQFVPGNGFTDPVHVEIRQGTDKATAIATLRAILVAVEKHFDEAIQLPMGGYLRLATVNVTEGVESALQSVAATLADVQKALNPETKKPQTVSKTSLKLGGEEKKSKAAAAR